MGKSKHVPRDVKKLEKKAFKADKQEIKKEMKELIIHNETKLGVHNCPAKDAGTTHPFRARCLKQRHAGYCPACGGIFSTQHGCKQHEIKGDRMLECCPTEDEKRVFRETCGKGIASAARAETDSLKPRASVTVRKGKEKKQSPVKIRD